MSKYNFYKQQSNFSRYGISKQIQQQSAGIDGAMVDTLTTSSLFSPPSGGI